MRLAALVVLTWALMAAPAAATHSKGSGPPHDFVSGSADNQLMEVTPYPVWLEVAGKAFDAELPTLDGMFTSSATKGYARGAGELPGRGAFYVEGPITCLKVVGNRATIKYRFTSTSGPGAPPPGWGVQVFVEDNGPSGDANATDAPLPPELFEPQADRCELPRGPYNPVDAGDYVVHDADAAPLALR